MKQIVEEYAKAIFALACETNEEVDIMDALDRAADILHEYAEYADFIASPAVPSEVRVRAIAECLKRVLPEYVISLMQLMCRRGHMSFFPECIRRYRRLLDIRQNVHVAHVMSAVPLTEGQKAMLIKKLEQISGNETIRPDYSVDSALLGGVVIEMDGRRISGSLRDRINEIRGVMNG